MKTFTFHGASDDCFCAYGDFSEELGDCASGSIMEYGIREEKSGNFVLYVAGQYSPNNTGCWRISIEPADEDFDFTGWEFGYEPMGYCGHVSVICPDGYSCVPLADKD